MKLVVVLSRVPYPLEKGDKLRAYHQIKHIAKANEVHLLCVTDQKVDKSSLDHLSNIVESIQVFQLPKWRILLNLFFGLLGDWPLQVHYFYQRSVRKKMHRCINQIAPDHVFCQLIRTSEYVKDLHQYPKTLDYMDAFSKGIERRVLNEPWWKKWLLKIEQKRLVNYENLIFDYFDNHTIISEQDRRFIYHAKRDDIHVIRNGVDATFFGIERQEDPKLVLLFTGNMSYPPNVDCAQYLAQDVMPLVWKQQPSAELRLAGANPHQKVTELASEKVVVTGWVDDIREEYAKASIFVAPMRMGTGLQNKLLEAMSMELPSVTSALANNALQAQPDHDVLIGNDAQEVASKILELIADEDKQKAIAKAGKEYVTKRFTWEGTVEQLEKVLQGTS